MALQNYESSFRCFPASTILNLNTTVTSNNLAWGIHGRILEYLEQASLYREVDLTQPWDFQAAIDGLRIPLYSCPSDPGAHRLRDPGGGKVRLYPTYHPGVVQCVFVDGSVRPVADGVDLSTWRALATRSGGEVVPTF